MAGRAASSAVTRYAGIQVQSSALGLQIPVGWGTFRCKCNLVDYLDFKSSAQKAASGKGGATVTGYTYSATIILAVCEGPIDKITQVWVDSNNFANGSVGSGVANTGSTSALAQAGLSLNTGAIAQAVWSYLTSAHPDHAIGYSGLAIVYAENYALDSSASTPNHSFEVVRTASFGVGSTPDADPSLVITDFFTNTRTGVPSWGSGLLGSLTALQNYTLAAGLLVSPVIDQERSASDFLTELLLATNCTCVWSEGLLKFIPYGDAALTGNGKTYTPNNTPVYALTDNQFAVDSDGDPPLLCDIEDQSDAYNVVQLEYLDRTNAYNMAIALASDAANVAQFGMRRQDPTTVHCICTPAVAALSAQLYLQRTLYIRAQYRFKLDWAFALLEPGDLLELTDAGVGLSAYMVRIIQIDEDENGGLSLTCEDYPIGVSNTPLYTMQAGVGTQTNKSVDPGGVEANLLLQSNALSTSPWTDTNLTVTAAAAADPITGATDAASLKPTVTNGVHSAVQAATLFAGANYTATGYFKANGYSGVVLSLSDGSDSVTAAFDLSGGVLVSEAVTGSGTLISASLTPVTGASGWYRAQLTVQLPGTSVSAGVFVTATGGSTTSFAGNGTSSILAYGLQLTQGVDARTYAATTTAISGPQIFNPPSTLTQGGLETWCALAGGPNFGGADVWVSLDGGSTYQLVATAGQGSARYGVLTSSFGSGSDPDTTNTCSIDLSASSGTLDSAADAVADANATLCLIDSELISFSTATLANPNRYNLTTYTRRGCQGTAIASHAAGAEIIRLDDACAILPFLPVQAGVSAFVKFQPFNLWGLGQPPLSDCVAYPFIPATVAVGTSPNGNNNVGGEITPTNNPFFFETTDPTGTAPDKAEWFNSLKGTLYKYVASLPGWVLMNGYSDGDVMAVLTATGSFTNPSNGPPFWIIEGYAPGGGAHMSNNHGGGAGGFFSYHVATTPGVSAVAAVIHPAGVGQSIADSIAATAGGNVTVTTSSPSLASPGTLTAVGGGAATNTAAGTGGGASGPTGGTYTTGEAGDLGATGNGGANLGTIGGARQTVADTQGNSPGGGGSGGAGTDPAGGGGVGEVRIIAKLT